MDKNDKHRPFSHLPRWSIRKQVLNSTFHLRQPGTDTVSPNLYLLMQPIVSSSLQLVMTQKCIIPKMVTFTTEIPQKEGLESRVGEEHQPPVTKPSRTGR